MSLDNPHVAALPEPPERCKFCGVELPADWDEQGWHEVTRRHAPNLAVYYTCDPCYWAEVYDGPLQDPGEAPPGPTTEQRAEMRRGGTR